MDYKHSEVTTGIIGSLSQKILFFELENLLHRDTRRRHRDSQRENNKNFSVNLSEISADLCVPVWFRLVGVRALLTGHIGVHRRYQRAIFKTCLAFLLVIIIVAYSNPAALAIGPGTGGSKIRVNEENVGPYTLLVATSPLPVTLDQQMSVWVRVSDPVTNDLRREAQVVVAATHHDTGQTLTAEATHKNAGNDYDYVAHFDIKNSGQWDVTVTISDEPGVAEVSFVESVSSGLSVTIIIALGIPFIVLAVIIGVYLWRRSATA